ncbi:aldehyde dehydrogenase family protein [Herbaspirillum sp. CAH-3]|nr:benzaldehyde dehydrogenase [Herbaspirillum sp. CAH-3]MRT27788.1 aldehyde dehydrogenase family protein [Herbaspirillum sp. CAH-3]
MMDTKQSQKWSSKIYSNGWQTGTEKPHSVVEPATGEQLGTVGVGSSADIARAAEIAAAAQRAWAETTFTVRAEILRKAASLLRQRAEEFTYWNIRECGSIRPKADFELDATYEQLQMAAGMLLQPDGLMYPSTMPGRLNFTRHVPIGVVGVISPWNFPLLLGMRSVAPALAMGNSVILKPDVQSAITGGALIAEIFEEAGLPPGVLHVIPGAAATGDALVRHPKVGMISFTGSTAVGRQIGAICGQTLKKVSLELGGNNVQIVLEDADLDAAASSGAWGSFLHQGQICMQTGRHLVHKSVAKQYAEKLAERAQRLQVGNPFKDQVHLGPLINERQRDRIAGIVKSSVDTGAKVLAGGTYKDLFFQATVLGDVTSDMPVFTEEIFGPVAPITVFENEDHAVELANSSEYGLAAAIHTKSVARGIALASRVRAGMVHINDQTVNNEFHVPFGGMGASGNGGRFGGPANFHEFTQTQWVSAVEKGIQYPF